jgi:hypothetical protein
MSKTLLFALLALVIVVAASNVESSTEVEMSSDVDIDAVRCCVYFFFFFHFEENALGSFRIPARFFLAASGLALLALISCHITLSLTRNLSV